MYSWIGNILVSIERLRYKPLSCNPTLTERRCVSSPVIGRFGKGYRWIPTVRAVTRNWIWVQPRRTRVAPLVQRHQGEDHLRQKADYKSQVSVVLPRYKEGRIWFQFLLINEQAVLGYEPTNLLNAVWRQCLWFRSKECGDLIYWLNDFTARSVLFEHPGQFHVACMYGCLLKLVLKLWTSPEDVC